MNNEVLPNPPIVPALPRSTSQPAHTQSVNTNLAAETVPIEALPIIDEEEADGEINFLSSMFIHTLLIFKVSHNANDNDRNPFASPGSSPAPPFITSQPLSPGAKSFQFPSPRTDSNDSNDGIPYTPLRQMTANHQWTSSLATNYIHGSPRIGPHSMQWHSHLPSCHSADGKKKMKADDVWMFFKELDGHNECIFCQ